MIATKWKEFEIKADFIGHKNWSCDSKFTNYNYHKVYIKNTETGVSTNFEYWTSNAHPVMTDDRDLLYALDCILGDAIAGKMEYEEFCSEFGYPVYREDGYVNANSKRVWKACKNSLAKCERVFVGYEIEDIYNELVAYRERSYE